MKPLGCFGFILRYATRKAEGRAFSFIMHQQRFTMLSGNIVRADKVQVERWGDSTYLSAHAHNPCIG